MCYTYIVRCADGTLYTGWTNDLQRRIKAHNSGKGAKYTSQRTPVELVYYAEYDTRQLAQRNEYTIKQMPRKYKLELIASFTRR